VAERGVDPEQLDVEFPVQGMKEVCERFKGVVGAWFGVSEVMEEQFNRELIGWVEEEMFSESVKGGVGNGGNGVGFEVVGSEKEGEVPFASGSGVV
jgi:hypothetical protein